MKALILVFVGGGLGSSARFGVDYGFRALWPEGAEKFPWATLVVNLVGCLIIGLGVGLIKGSDDLQSSLRYLLLVGFCGGLTTFSTFANQTLALDSGKGMINVAVSVVGCLAMVWLGLMFSGGRAA